MLPVTIRTPLGADALSLESFEGSEAVSELFEFRVRLLADQPLPFERLLGQAVTISVVPLHGTRRLIHGIINELSQGTRLLAGNRERIRYRASIVPRLWLLSQRVQSRIFLDRSVPQILAQVLGDEWQLSHVPQLNGSYPVRDHIVQYRESDLAFVSRLLEEEGIYYFFEHKEDEHVLVLRDTTAQSGQIAAPHQLNFDTVQGGTRDEPRVHGWEKTQRLGLGKYNVRDRAFELPEQHLEAEHTVAETVAIGQVQHALSHAHTDRFECFDYPAEFAHWFDGIDKQGAAQPSVLEKIFEQNERLARLRMERATCAALRIDGESNVCHLTPGYQFQLARHFDGNGSYWLERVEHHLEQREPAGGERAEAEFVYRNRFVCLPRELAYRPERRTPRPRVAGTQTAVVVGPAGQSIFCDKYGRIKVQFGWDREHQHDAESSCWLRVAHGWAGKGYGMVAIPRVGQEVLVDFLEGNPDRPIVVGSVYNATQMPPFELPEHANLTCLKTRSVNGRSANFNGLALHDQPGAEHVQLHAERDMTLSSENNKSVYVGADQSVEVIGSHTHVVHADQTEKVSGSHKHSVGTTYHVSVGAPGSGSGSGAPWDYITDGGTPMPHVAGAGGAFLQDIWGAFDVSVIGAYACTVVGNQTYFTALGSYQNIVLGAFHLNLNSLGVLMNVIAGAEGLVNYFKGPVYNLHEEGETKVGLAPITITSTALVTVSSPASVVLQCGATTDINLSPAGITLQFGAVQVSLSAAGILLNAGAASLQLLTNGDVRFNGANLDVAALVAAYP